MKSPVKTILIAMWVVTGLTVAGVAAGVWFYRQRTGTPPAAHVFADEETDGAPLQLKPLFDAPTFSLTDQDGKPFTSQQLRGKVWVADFVFTSCTSLCPMMTQQMTEFQKSTPGSPVQMVSFSVDPENDTPKVLKGYADAAKADLTRWHFLTGGKKTLWDISNGMKLAVGPDDGSHQIFHSSHFLLVDQAGHVRGIYDYNSPGFMAKLRADAAALARR
jgi:protein SCO1/2